MEGRLAPRFLNSMHRPGRLDVAVWRRAGGQKRGGGVHEGWGERWGPCRLSELEETVAMGSEEGGGDFSARAVGASRLHFR